MVIPVHFNDDSYQATSAKSVIFGHAEFTAFNQSVTKLYEKWKTTNLPRPTGLDTGSKPKALIDSDEFFTQYRRTRARFMSYFANARRRIVAQPIPHRGKSRAGQAWDSGSFLGAPPRQRRQ